ncbi:MAG: pentapeptide repeat-containing protein [Microcystis panniformis]
MSQKNETTALIIALLATAGIVGGGYFWLQSQFREQSKLQSERQALIKEKAKLEAEKLNHRQLVLSGYFDAMNLLIQQGLKAPQRNQSLKDTARKITLETLPKLDDTGKGELLKFLDQKTLLGNCPIDVGWQYCEIPGRLPIISLVGADLSGAKLKSISFNNGVDLRGVDLRGADLRYSDLTRANLTKANLSGADLSGANLQGANLTQAYLRVAKLRNAKLGCENWHFCRETASLEQADLQDANLEGANLGRTDLKKANFRGANLMSAQLAGADLEQAVFAQANLSGAKFSYYWKGSCSDPQWEATIAQVKQTDFTGANLSRADLTGLMFDQSGIPGAKMTNVNLKDAKIGDGPSPDEC